MIDSHSRKIGNNNRIVKRRNDAGREKLFATELLATHRTNNPASVYVIILATIQIPPPFICLPLRRRRYLFSEIRSPLDVGRGVLDVERNVISLNATYKINVVALKLPTCSQL